MKETRAWIRLLTPEDLSVPGPELRPKGVEHDIPVLYPSPYISDAMVVYINYIMRGSFDDVFPKERPVQCTLDDVRTIFSHYQVAFPNRCALKPRFREHPEPNGLLRRCMDVFFWC